MRRFLLTLDTIGILCLFYSFFFLHEINIMIDSIVSLQTLYIIYLAGI